MILEWISLKKIRKKNPTKRNLIKIRKRNLIKNLKKIDFFSIISNKFIKIIEFIIANTLKN